MSDLLESEMSAQNLEEQAVMSIEALNQLRLKIVEENYDPSPEEMAAAIQSIRPARAKESAPRERKRKASVKVDLSDFE